MATRRQYRELRRVRYVTENYQHIPGLVSVALGIGVCLAGAVNLLGLHAFGVDFALAAAGGLVSLRVRRHYKHRFGRVEPLHRGPIFRSWKSLALVLGFAVLSFLGLVLLASMPGMILQPNFLYLELAVFGLLASWPVWRYRLHYIAAATILLMLGVLGYAALLPSILITNGAVLIAGGLALIGTGLIDHLILVKTLHPVKEEADEPAV